MKGLIAGQPVICKGNYMKLISWNVNGLRACVQKGFLDFFQDIDADIFCIQESKLQAGQIDLDLKGTTSIGTMR